MFTSEQIKRIALNCKNIENYSDDFLRGFEEGFKYLEKKTDDVMAKNILMMKQLGGLQQLLNLLDIKIDLSVVNYETVEKIKNYVDNNDTVLFKVREYMPFN